MKKTHVSGIRGDTEVFVLNKQQSRVYKAKWWMRPICWVLRRPTEFTR